MFYDRGSRIELEKKMVMVFDTDELDLPNKSGPRWKGSLNILGSNLKIVDFLPWWRNVETFYSI
jgi:hypothetical protein